MTNSVCKLKYEYDKLKVILNLIYFSEYCKDKLIIDMSDAVD